MTMTTSSVCSEAEPTRSEVALGEAGDGGGEGGAEGGARRSARMSGASRDSTETPRAWLASAGRVAHRPSLSAMREASAMDAAWMAVVTRTLAGWADRVSASVETLRYAARPCLKAACAAAVKADSSPPTMQVKLT
ncbi:hypothetical protein AB1Y20_006503 [Prymnesium parvum]|uniref:Uncharacterized protein n=1 Tax=Prymnesium parvum TaxID=97485 RepID=A0AB34J0E0_PRYPA